MAFAIMRSEKIKSAVSLKRAVQHNTRERMPSNADEKRSAQNWTVGGAADDVMQNYHERLPDKVRSNAVHAIEFMMTASPEFSGDWDTYLKSCDQWVEKMFGKENILSVAHHKDETTPHTHVLVMPLKDKKLNAKFFLGGSSHRLIELQNDFFKEVGLPAGLERGKPKSETNARHDAASLDKKAKQLDEREKIIADKSVKLDEREKKINEVAGEFKNLMGMKPDDVRSLKTLVENWDKTTPAGLRVIAGDIERSGTRTVGDYRKSREQERQQTQNRKL